ncbi:MAG: glycine cleavage system aminomethyltransferase GcvT [Planctomycetes bacterium]|nr:glycine cleavage system aminomethyltransferase GcvT [Planctomycetota bacterium]
MSETPLSQSHIRRGARMVDFHGWSMPLLFSNIIEEHKNVRMHAGVFDVSHMGRLRITGSDGGGLLERILTRSIKGLKPGRARYSLLCNEKAGVVDDLIVYASTDYFLLVVNASNRENVVAVLDEQRQGMDVTVEDLTFDLAMIALQGPVSAGILRKMCSPKVADLKRFAFGSAKVGETRALIARTGYTGEDGFEILVDKGHVNEIWDRLIDFGAAPTGLGARDTLRIEAGLPLYGHELGLDTNPFEAGLEWAVDLEGRNCLGAARMRLVAADGPIRKVVGLEIEGRKIARENMPVLKDMRKVGTVTSGTFSPTLEKTIALARVETKFAVEGTELVVDIRGSNVPATVVPIPFYRRTR